MRKVSPKPAGCDDDCEVPTKVGDSVGRNVDAAGSEQGPAFLGVPMKYISLVSLTLQTSAQVFVIKWAKAGSIASGTAYLASTVVFFTELTKVFASMCLVAREHNSLRTACTVVYESFTKDPMETAKMCVPALLYTVQNNLMFFSLSKLSMAVQQVTYQLKILTTAILSVIILGKVLTKTKWFALVILLAGVSLIQWPRNDEGNLMIDNFSFGSDILHNDAILGFLAVLAACFTSGFASVWLEKMLKSTSVSIWVRNVQLGAIGSVMAMLVAVTADGMTIWENGPCHGFSARVVCTILNNALGGLLCAAVLKYADNILRCFSTSLSIVLTCSVSALGFQEFVADNIFLIGTMLAIFSTFLYSIDLSALFAEMRHVAKIVVQDNLKGSKSPATTPICIRGC